MAVIFLIGALLLSLIILVPAAHAAGFKRGLASAKSKELEYSCTHVWEQWKPLDITYYHPVTGREMYTVSGQQRKCDVCGYRQTRKIEDK